VVIRHLNALPYKKKFPSGPQNSKNVNLVSFNQFASEMKLVESSSFSLAHNVASTLNKKNDVIRGSIKRTFERSSEVE